MDDNLIHTITFKNIVVPYQIMTKYIERKLEPKIISASNRTFAALVISLSMLTATIMLSTMTDD